MGSFIAGVINSLFSSEPVVINDIALLKIHWFKKKNHFYTVFKICICLSEWNRLSWKSMNFKNAQNCLCFVVYSPVDLCCHFSSLMITWDVFKLNWFYRVNFSEPFCLKTQASVSFVVDVVWNNQVTIQRKIAN